MLDGSRILIADFLQAIANVIRPAVQSDLAPEEKLDLAAKVVFDLKTAMEKQGLSSQLLVSLMYAANATRKQVGIESFQDYNDKLANIPMSSDFYGGLNLNLRIGGESAVPSPTPTPGVYFGPEILVQGNDIQFSIDDSYKSIIKADYATLLRAVADRLLTFEIPRGDRTAIGNIVQNLLGKEKGLVFEIKGHS